MWLCGIKFGRIAHAKYAAACPAPRGRVVTQIRSLGVRCTLVGPITITAAPPPRQNIQTERNGSPPPAIRPAPTQFLALLANNADCRLLASPAGGDQGGALVLIELRADSAVHRLHIVVRAGDVS